MDFKLIDEAMLRCYVSTYIITSAKEGMFSLCLFHIRNTDRIFIKVFTRDVSLDKEATIKILKVMRIWIRT